jgi:uroporphyrinogen decarboxylase
MTERERFIAALERRPITGRVPHFELVFFLTMEALGKVHPEHRRYGQWKQMTETEKELIRRDQADCYIDIAEKYHHSAMLVLAPDDNTFEERIKFYSTIREKSGDKYFVMISKDPTYSIPSGDRMVDFSAECAEEPEKVKKRAQESVDRHIREAEALAKYPGLVDGIAMCSDYCFNTNPFFSPAMFSEFVTPYLAQIIKAYRELGFYTIKHTDGNIMPILDQMVQCGPHALHSLDPQAGVDLANVKRLVGDRVCLIGNVNCGLLQTGTDEQVVADVRRALRQGMPGYSYIFSTSNCVYTGMELSRYELMNKIWYEEGVYR